MQAGRQGGGDPHDQAEVDVLGIFPSGRVLQGLNGPVGVGGSSLREFLGRVFPQADDPTPEGEDEENPKGGQNGDHKVQREMKYVFRGLCGCEGPANDPDRDEEGKAVEKGSENSHGDLQFDIVRGFVGLHVVGEGRVDGPPVAGYVQNDEEEEEERKEYLDCPSLSLIEIENLMEGLPPDCDDPIHFEFCRTDRISERHVPLLFDRLLASLDDFHASNGIFQGGQGCFTFSYDFLQKMQPHGTDGVGIGGIGLGVHDGGGILNPVPITVASCSLSPDYLDHEGPRIPRMVVRCETGTQVGKRVVLHLQGDHGEVLLWDASVVDCRFHAGCHFGSSCKVERTVRMVGEDLTDDSRIPPCDFFGVVDVVEDINGHDLTEFPAFNQVLGSHDGGFVNVIVYGSDLDAFAFGRFLDFLDLGDRDCGGLFHEDVLACFDGLHGIGMVGFHVGENIDDVDRLDQFLGTVENLGCEKRGFFLRFGTGTVPNARQFRISRRAHAFPVQVRNITCSNETYFDHALSLSTENAIFSSATKEMRLLAFQGASSRHLCIHTF